MLTSKRKTFEELGLLDQAFWPFVIMEAGVVVYARGEKKINAYLLGTPGALADILAVLQPSQDLLDKGLLFPGLLLLQALTALARLLLLVLEGLLYELDILQPELLADDIEVAGGVDVSLDVDDLGIVETPHDLEDGVDGADVRQEGIPETGTGGSTARQTGNVVDCEVGRDARLGLVLLAQPVEAIVRDNDASLLRVDGGVGEVLHRLLATVSRLHQGRGRELTAGFPKSHLVMAWKSVDLPTFASPT